MGDAAVVCRGLAKRYGSVWALAGLDLTIPAGSVFGLLGPNGAGKTTTLRLLTGMARPTQGSAVVAGMPADAPRTARGRGASGTGHFGYLGQEPRYYTWMRGRELLRLVAELGGLDDVERRSRIPEVLELVGMTDAADRAIGGYSGGMRQRIGLAAALLDRPPVLFLDEPVSALDPAGRHDVLGVIAGLRGSTTVLMSTHILDDVERVCDGVAILDRGRLLVASTMQDLLRQYAQPVCEIEPYPDQDSAVATFLGRVRAQAWVTAVAADHEPIRVHVRDPRAAAPALLGIVADTGLAVSRLEMVRPSLEDVFLRIVTDGRADPSSTDRSEGQIP